MYLKKWDIEFEIIKKEFEELSTYTKKFLADHKNIQKINSLKLHLQYLQSEIAAKLEKILMYASQKDKVQNIQKTILHWAGIYAQKMQDFIIKKYQNLDKMMYLSIIKFKLPATSGTAKFKFEDEDIIQLSIRQANLIQTEKELSEYLMQLKLKKEALHQKYNDLCVSSANKEAMLSINNSLGRNIYEAKSNPLWQSLKNLMNIVTSPIKLYFIYNKHKDAVDELCIKTQSIIKECKELALNDMRYPRYFNTPSFQNKLNKYLMDINQMQDKLLEIKSSLDEESLPQLKPKIKKLSITEKFAQKLKHIPKNFNLLVLIGMVAVLLPQPYAVSININRTRHDQEVNLLINNNYNPRLHRRLSANGKADINTINAPQKFIDKVSNPFMQTFEFLSSDIQSNLNSLGLKIRKDLYPKLQNLVCNKRSLPSSAEVLQLGIFDSQISGQLLKFKSTSSTDFSTILRLAQTSAKKQDHHGIIFGQCDNNTYWYVTLPASDPIVITASEEYQIPYKPIQRYCAKLKISYINAYKGSAKNITPDLRYFTNSDVIKLNTSLLEDGIISVTCYSSSLSNNLSTMWYFLPVKQGPYTVAPYNKFLQKKDIDTETKIVKWLNAIRNKHQLNSVLTHKFLNVVAKALSKTNSVNHDKKNLMEVKSVLEKQGFYFVSEQRVKGKDITEAAWLLWNSPDHRSALLEKNSTHVGIYYDIKNNETFIVVVFAKAKPKSLNNLLSIMYNFISF